MVIIKKKNIPILLFMILGFISIFTFIDYHYSINRINSGVYFKSIHLGGKSFKEVEKILNTSHFTFLGPEGKTISIPLKEMGINLNYNQIFQTGYQLSPPKPWFRNYLHRLRISKEKVFVPFQYLIDKKLWSQSINSLVEHFSSEPENAYFKVSNNNQVEIIPEKLGYNFNHDDLEQVIMANLAQPNSPLEIKIPFAKKIPPKITVSSLKEKSIENLMISFSTTFDLTLTNRVHNIKLAAATLNNYLLAPGEVLSFNRVIGNTTVEKGYKAANIIVGGKLVPGIGGGLCQISSTLYNAALLANLEIIERHSHQLTVPYIDPGRDATICYQSKDLAFCNNKDHYILITIGVVEDKLTVSFFGQPLDERVEIKINVLDTFPPPERSKQNSELKPDEQEIVEGYPGYLVEVWKIVYRDEKKEKEEKISVDKYSPFQITKQGPGH